MFNSFLQVAIELGLVGLALLSWLLWRVASTLWRAMRDARMNSVDSAWLVCMLMVLAGFLLRNQFDHLLRDDPGHLFWILMGLGIGRAMTASSSSSSRSPT